MRAAHRQMGIFPLCYLIVFPFTDYGWHFVVVMMKARLGGRGEWPKDHTAI